jgi:hypothetical protein
LAPLGRCLKVCIPVDQARRAVERFHQTQKRWLAQQPPAATLQDLQRQLDAFREHYNEHRPNRAVQRSTPGQAYRALPKAGPGGTPHGYYRLRYDPVDAVGKVSIRQVGRMHHLGVGAAHRGREILAITDLTGVTVIELRTGEVLSAHDIDPARAYWRNKQRSPGRWPGLPVT